MKVLLAPGLRYSANQTLTVLNSFGAEITVASGVPKRRWKTKGNETFRFIPIPFKILQKLNLVARTKKLKEWDSIFFGKLCAYLLTDQFDVFHGWASYSLEPMRVAKSQGVRVFLERSCPHILFQNRILLEEAELTGAKFDVSSGAFVERMIEEYELADQIIVPSKYSLASFLELGFERSKLSLVPIGGNLSKKPIKRRQKKPNQKFVVGTIGGNVLRKGIIYLVDAFLLLKIPDSKLILKCSRSELKKIPDLYSKITRNANIIVTEYYEKIEHFYSELDVFVLPSIDEGYGMVVDEALSFNIPTIITENVGAGAHLEASQILSIVPIRNVEAIASNIEQYYEKWQQPVKHEVIGTTFRQDPKDELLALQTLYGLT